MPARKKRTYKPRKAKQDLSDVTSYSESRIPAETEFSYNPAKVAPKPTAKVEPIAPVGSKKFKAALIVVAVIGVLIILRACS